MTARQKQGVRPGGADGFDRIRPRTGGGAPAERPAGAVSDPRGYGTRDPEGRRALFSVAAQDPPPGTLTLSCSACRRTSLLSPRQVFSLALPSVHLPLLKWRYPSWMRCPACRRRTWVALGVKF